MNNTESTRDEARRLLEHFGVRSAVSAAASLAVTSPISGEPLAQLPVTSAAQAREAIANAHIAFLTWRAVPMPRRGEFVRRFGEALRSNLDPLGVSSPSKSGKSLSEGRGEVQEMVYICVYAAGLSRTIGGSTLESERSSHRLMERWHSLGVVGVISAFNFPVAVWS